MILKRNLSYPVHLKNVINFNILFYGKNTKSQTRNQEINHNNMEKITKQTLLVMKGK